MSIESDRTEAARVQAETRFKATVQRKSDGEKAWAEMQAGKAASIVKTDRLRALRLAKEEADRVEAAAAPPPAKPKRAARKKKTA